MKLLFSACPLGTPHVQARLPLHQDPPHLVLVGEPLGLGGGRQKGDGQPGQLRCIQVIQIY